MTKRRAKVFDETYNCYLKQILQLDYLAKAEVLGVEVAKESLKIPLYDTVYCFNADGITTEGNGHITAAVQVMICKYILTCPPEVPEIIDTLVTYREFKDAGPLISYFTTNTNKTLESTFGGRVAALKKRGQDIGGKILDSNTYDLSLLFHAFPRVPVVVNFNDQDDLFSATCSVLYRSSAALFLDMECLAMTGTLLTGKLIAAGNIL